MKKISTDELKALLSSSWLFMTCKTTGKDQSYKVIEDLYQDKNKTYFIDAVSLRVLDHKRNKISEYWLDAS